MSTRDTAMAAPPLFDMGEPLREAWAGERVVRVKAWELWPARYALDGITRLCRWCAKPLEGNRSSYCSDACTNELWVRGSLPALRTFIFKRDKGICKGCGLNVGDLIEAGKWLQKKSAEIRAASPQNWKLVDHWPTRQQLFHAMGFRTAHIWEVNHILGIADGGDPVDPSNLELLCELCHRKHTAALVRRLAKAKRIRKKFHNGVTT